MALPLEFLSRAAQNRLSNELRPSYQSWLPGSANSLRSGSLHRERPVVRRQQLLLVFLARGLRIALVAAHDQDLAVPQPAGLADVEVVLGEQVGDRVGGLEAVAHVGDVVDPEGAVLVGGDAPVRVGSSWDRCSRSGSTGPCRRCRIRHGLDEALIGILAEYRGDDRAHADACQQPRVVPRHHLRQLPQAQLPQRTQLGHDPASPGECLRV